MFNTTSLPFPSLVLQDGDFHLYRRGEPKSKRPLQVRLFKLDWTPVDDHYSNLIEEYGLQGSWVDDLHSMECGEKGDYPHYCAELKAKLQNSLGLPKRWLKWIDGLRFGFVPGGDHEKTLLSYTRMASECATIEYECSNVDLEKLLWHAHPMILNGLLVQGAFTVLSDCLVDTEASWWDRRGVDDLLTIVLSYRLWYRHIDWGLGSASFGERTGYRRLVEHNAKLAVLPKVKRRELSKKISLKKSHVDKLEEKFVLDTAGHVFFEQDLSHPGVPATDVLLYQLFPGNFEYLTRMHPELNEPMGEKTT